MKMLVSKTGFLPALQTAAGIAATKDVKPTLKYVKCIAQGDRCTLIATDLEIGIRLDVLGVKIVEDGETLLPPSRLVPILRESPDDEVTIEATPDRITVTGTSSEFEMPGEDVTAFPDVPALDLADDHFIIKSGELAKLIKRTMFAAAASEHSKFGATTGILWECASAVAVRLVATDGRRLAVATAESGTADMNGAVIRQGSIVPRKALAVLEKTIGIDEAVQVSFRPNEVLFRTPRATIYSRLVEGRFPNWNQVMPKNTKINVPLNAGRFHAAIRQAGIMADDESKRVIFTFARGKLTLAASGSSSGKSKVEMPLDGFDWPNVTISFDPKFLREMLNIIPGDSEIVMQLADKETPAVIRVGENFLYVVVPLVGGS